MAVEAIKSAQITNQTASPKVPNTSFNAEGGPVHSVAHVLMNATASIGSTYRLGRVRSGDRVDTLQYAQTVGTGGVGRNNDFGIYDIEGGAVVSAALLAKNVTFAAAVASYQELIPGSASAVLTVLNVEQRIWELLGLASDPDKEYDLTITCNEANTTLAIDIAVQWGVIR